MAAETSFRGHSIVCCGTLRPEMRALQQSGFLDADRILFTAPGLHESPPRLAEQLTKELAKAKETSRRVIVVYGSRCYLNLDDPAEDVDALIRDDAGRARRIQAKNCVDMLADAEARDRIACGSKVYWLTTGWLEYWDYIFKDWEAAMANGTGTADQLASARASGPQSQLGVGR